jgi:hypothetical protein
MMMMTTMMVMLLVILVVVVVAIFNPANQHDLICRDTADALRLFKYFKLTEGAGGVGGFITTLFFTAIILFGIALLVFYGFAIYKNGAIMDAIWRLYSEERSFFLPFDTEIDSGTLTNLIERAQKYRGKSGITRKVVVTDLSVKVRSSFCIVSGT